MFCRTPPTKFLLSPKKLVKRDQHVPGYFHSRAGAWSRDKALGTRLDTLCFQVRALGEFIAFRVICLSLDAI